MSEAKKTKPGAAVVRLYARDGRLLFEATTDGPEATSTDLAFALWDALAAATQRAESAEEREARLREAWARLADYVAGERHAAERSNPNSVWVLSNLQRHMRALQAPQPEANDGND